MLLKEVNPELAAELRAKYKIKKVEFFYNDNTTIVDIKINDNKTESTKFSVGYFPHNCGFMIMSSWWFAGDYHAKQLNMEPHQFQAMIAKLVKAYWFHNFPRKTIIYTTASYQEMVITMLKKAGFKPFHTQRSRSTGSQITFWRLK